MVWFNGTYSLGSIFVAWFEVCKFLGVAEVTKLEITIFVKQDIAWLEVGVDNPV